MNRKLLLPLLLVAAGLVYLLLGPGPESAGPGGTDGTSTSAEAAAAPAETGGRAAEAAPGLEPASRTDLAGAGAGGAAAAGAAPRGIGSLLLRLVDGRGQPVRDVEVALSGRDPRRSGDFAPGFFLPGMQRQAEETDAVRRRPDAQGRVRFDGVEARLRHRLVVSGDYRVERRLDLAPLLAGETRDLGELALADGVVLAGRVTGPDSRPAGGAVVTVSQERGEGFSFGPMAAAEIARATTGADGSFRLAGLPTGSFRVNAARAGALAAERKLELTPAPRDHHAELALTAGAEVRGRVFAADGSPLAGARVVLAPADGFASFSWDRSRVEGEGLETGADGRFTLGGLGTERMRILATAEGHALHRSGTVRAGQELEIQLGAMHELNGLLVDADGSPVAGGEITLMPQDPGDSGFGMLRMDHARTEADGSFRLEGVEDGEYLLRAVAAAGKLERPGLRVPEALGEPLRLVLDGGPALVVTLKDSSGRPLPGAELSARSTANGPGDVMLAPGQARVSVAGPAFGQEVRRGVSDDAGRVRLVGLDPGTWNLRARLDGYATLDHAVERTAAERQEEELVLQPAGTLVVRAVDTFGAPVPRLGLELRSTEPDSGFRPQSGQADDWGVAMWEDLPPGRYGVYEAGGSPQFAFASSGDTNFAVDLGGPTPGAAGTPTLTVVLPAGQTLDEQLVVATKAMARVRVTRLGEPVAGATVQLEARSNGGISWGGFGGFGGGPRAETDAEGWAELPPCDPGAYELSARAAGTHPPTTREVDLGAGPQSLDLALASGEVSGVVTGPGGVLAGATVRLKKGSPDEESSGHGGRVVMSMAIAGDDDEAAFETIDFSPGSTTVTTGADGVFRFRDVPPGTWHLDARAPGCSSRTSDAFELAEGARLDYGMIELPGSGGLRGTILGLPPAGDPASGAFTMTSVRLIGENDEDVQFSIVQPNGRYRFNDVPPGTYRLRVDAGGKTSTSEPVVVAAGPATPFDFQL